MLGGALVAFGLPVLGLRWRWTLLLGAMTPTLAGLKPRGQLVVVGASPDPLQVPPFAIIPGSTAVQGHASGTSQDSEDTLRFSVLTGVRPRIETLPLAEAQAAYDKMMAGDARFRMVLTMTAG